MGEVGILDEDSRVELVEGEIVRMNPIGGPHAGTVNRLTRLFTRSLGDAVVVAVQNPIRIRPRNEPQPDLAILRPRADFYTTHPSPADALLVIEVADTTLSYDTGTKVPMYGRAGIPEAWVADLNRPALLVYREPTTDGYAAAHAYRPGEALSPLAFPNLVVAGDDVAG